MSRPFVYVNMAMTVDGKITSTGREYPHFTSRHDRKTMDKLRAQADAVLVGAGTLRADDPPLQVRDEEMQRLRASLGKPAHLTTVLVTASAGIDPDARFFTAPSEGTRIVATVEDAPADKVERLRARAEVWTLGQSFVDLPALCRRLVERGVERLLVEGGGELNWGFVRNDLVDEIYVTIAPALLGGRAAPTLLEGDGFSMSDRRRLRLLEIDRVGDEIYTRWAVTRAES